jgi:hypothetical protein
MFTQLPLSSNDGSAAFTTPDPAIHRIQVMKIQRTWEPTEEIGYVDQTG